MDSHQPTNPRSLEGVPGPEGGPSTSINEVNSAVPVQPTPSTIINAINSTFSVQPPGGSSSGRRDDIRFENIVGVTRQHLKTFDKRRFVETGAYHEARHRVQDLGGLVIVGQRGSGKTTIGMHLLKSFKRTPVILSSPEDWYTLPLRQSRRERMNVLVDNIFGFDNLDYHRKEAWLHILDMMSSQVQLGLVSVVILLSTDVYNICEKQLSRFSLFRVAHILSLSDPQYHLKPEEKLKMVQIHRKKGTPITGDTNIEMALAKLSNVAFPLICHTFASCREAQERGLQYFQNPVECIVKRFKILKEQNDVQYIVLVLLAVMQGRLPKRFFYPDRQSSEIKDIALVLEKVKYFVPRGVGIDLNKLQRTTDSMVGEYLTFSKRYQSYTYLNTLYYDSLLLSFADNHLQDVIDICPATFLVQYIPACNPSERSLAGQVQREHFKSLARRIAAELTEGDFFTILNHQALRDKQFVHVLTKQVLGCEGCTRICYRKIGFLQFYQKAPFNLAYSSLVSKGPHEIFLSSLGQTKRWLFNFKSLICLIIMQDLPLLANQIVSLSTCCFDRRLLHCACFMGLNDIVGEHPSISPLQLNDMLTTCIVSDKVKVRLFKKLLTWWRKTKQQSSRHIAYLAGLALAVFKETYVRELLKTLKKLPCDYAGLLDKFLQQMLFHCYYCEEVYRPLQVTCDVKISEARKLIQLLIDEGARDQDGKMIFMASQHKSSDALELLLRHSSSLEYTLTEGEGSWTLHLSSFKSCIIGTKGRTPLLEASCRSIESVKLLLAHGADVNAKDIHGYTILHSKLVYSDIECLKIILSTISPTLGSTSSPLLKASEFGNLDCFLSLLEWYSKLPNRQDVLIAQDVVGSTALHKAVLSGIDVRGKVEALIQAGADVKLTNNKGNSALHLASVGNSIEVVKKLIGSGADVNQRNEEGNTPLHFALSSKSTKACVGTLLEKGADILLENSVGVTPLFEAAGMASVETLELLLKYCPQNPLSTHDLKLNPLMASPNLNKVKLLTASGFCTTPTVAQKFLMVLSRMDFPTTSDMGVIDEFIVYPSESELEWQDEWYDKLVFHLCERGANINLLVEQSLERTWQHCFYDCSESISFEGNSSISDSDISESLGFTPLQAAMIGSHTKMVKCLLGMGADPNIKSAQGHIIPFKIMDKTNSKLFGSPLAFTFPISFEIIRLLTENERKLNFADNADKMMCAISERKFWKTLDFFLNQGGIDVNSRFDRGFLGTGTALHISCESWRCLEVLLKHNVNVNMQDDQGNTALHLLANRQKSQGKIALLLQKGADPNITNNKGQTPLLSACSMSQAPQKYESKQKEKICNFKGLENIKQRQTLRIKKRTVDITRCFNDTVEVLLKYKANGDVTDSDGFAALHVAVRQSNYELLCVLLNGGCDANVSDANGNTPLNLLLELVADCQQGTASYYIPHHRREIQVWKFVMELLDRNADADIQNSKKNAPLHHAASMNCQRSLELLLEAGVDVDVEDAHGKTPLHRCAQSGHARIARILLENSSDVNARDDKGDTPLHMAVRRKQYNMVKLLVQMGADLSETNTDGLTAYDTCVELEQSCSRAWWIHKGQKLLLVLNPVHEMGSF
ncbi:serine/threonine-protein phosphatase 6 regulatory ankyrin repeat subunit A-like [Haliotis rufescens]|uniref:serine/threonine-protein phosphatase 6 regulatory ankyrin repeat subunit A-like n=1 Tax=Haliotis rufescens TaxID=6454 RepID=UPI00201EED5C|nr:serine/threonine-protein phosphatase 6 regulatory ankyrin repeat subunit A-like [Haliotis rufescens]